MIKRIVWPSFTSSGFYSADGLTQLPWTYGFVPAREKRTTLAVLARDSERMAYEVRLPDGDGQETLGILAPLSIIGEARRRVLPRSRQRIADLDVDARPWEFVHESMQQIAEMRNQFPSCPPSSAFEIRERAMNEWQERGEQYSSRTELISVSVHEYVRWKLAEFPQIVEIWMPGVRCASETYMQSTTEQAQPQVGSILAAWRQASEIGTANRS